jgi:uncharacterized protein (TIGR02594 family)
MTPLPDKYKWLEKEKAPKMLIEAIRHYGILEHVGRGSNPDIMAWAKEVGVSGWYEDDDVPWCGLFTGVVVKRAGYPIKPDLLSSLSWLKFGEVIPKRREMLWDILIFKRPGGGHVGFYVGESDTAFLVYGGNEGNQVGFTWIDKARLLGARRPIYKIGEPDNVRKIFLTRDGELSRDEA